MLHTKFRGNRPVDSEEEDFLRFLPYMGVAAILVISPVGIAFGVPLIATETFFYLSESFLCYLQHTKSPQETSEGK